MFCSKCGKPLADGTAFCGYCGAAQQQTAPARPAAQEAQNPAAARAKTAAAQLGRTYSAPSRQGTFALDIPDISSPAEAVPGPLAAIFGGIGKIFTGLGRLPKSPLALISAIAMAGLWAAVMFWNGSDRANKASEIVSFLTFAEGGCFGSLPERIGGIFGKGVIVSSLMSLVSGGLAAIPGSFKALFSKGLNIGFMIFGSGCAVTAYSLFAGYADTYGIMVGVCGAAVSFLALGSQSGWLYTVAAALSSKKRDGVRTAGFRKVKGMLLGMTLGFAAAAALCRVDYPLWAAPLVAVLGLIIGLIIPDKGGAVQ